MRLGLGPLGPQFAYFRALEQQFGSVVAASPHLNGPDLVLSEQQVPLLLVAPLWLLAAGSLSHPFSCASSASGRLIQMPPDVSFASQPQLLQLHNANCVCPPRPRPQHVAAFASYPLPPRSHAVGITPLLQLLAAGSLSHPFSCASSASGRLIQMPPDVSFASQPQLLQLHNANCVCPPRPRPQHVAAFASHLLPPRSHAVGITPLLQLQIPRLPPLTRVLQPCVLDQSVGVH